MFDTHYSCLKDRKLSPQNTMSVGSRISCNISVWRINNLRIRFAHNLKRNLPI